MTLHEVLFVCAMVLATSNLMKLPMTNTPLKEMRDFFVSPTGSCPSQQYIT